jgi:hypothetical protein
MRALARKIEYNRAQSGVAGGGLLHSGLFARFFLQLTVVLRLVVGGNLIWMVCRV